MRRRARETLASYPELVEQWHPTKNGDLRPSEVTAGSHRRIWWICPAGVDHEWEANPANRVHGNGCPFCDGQRVSVTNALAWVAPHLAEQWHPTLNGSLAPSDVVAGAARRIWWKCPYGDDHVWSATLDNRVRAGSGCPFCSGHRACRGHSLADDFPEVAAEWHRTKNDPLTPHDVTSSSMRRVWWTCPRGPDHEWEGQVSVRTRPKPRGNGCPFCAGRRLSVTNCLATRFPKLAREWHPSKNAPVTPDQVLMGTAKRAWWICSDGHEWETRVCQRTAVGTGCPECNGILMVDADGRVRQRYRRGE